MKGHKDLWKSVLVIAIRDLKKPKRKRLSLAWFNRKDDEPGSFIWVCQVLSINHEKAIKAILSY